MDDSDGTYAPESPDLSAYHSSSYQPNPAPYQSNLQQFQPSQPGLNYGAATYYDPQQAGVPNYANYQEEPVSIKSEHMAEAAGLRSRAKAAQGPASVPARAAPSSGSRPAVEVKTKFPVARIKRIMQADEDVGKVAQVTPVAVSKALELFMIALVSSAAEEASSRSSKRITAAHLKRTVEKNQQLDFLHDITSKVPDAPAPSDKIEDAQDGGGGGEGKKPRGASRKKRKDSDDF